MSILHCHTCNRDIDSNSAAYAEHALHDLAPPLPKPTPVEPYRTRLKQHKDMLERAGLPLAPETIRAVLATLVEAAINSEDQHTANAYRDCSR